MLEGLRDSVQGLPGAFTTKVSNPTEPINKWLATWPTALFGVSSVSASEVMSAFGVYLIATYPEGDVIYIGKATPGAREDPKDRKTNHHLAGEMFVHIVRPPSTAVPGVMFHEGNLLSKRRMDSTTKKRVQEGGR
jgi:hypothetical protein